MDFKALYLTTSLLTLRVHCGVNRTPLNFRANSLEFTMQKLNLSRHLIVFQDTIFPVQHFPLLKKPQYSSGIQAK